MWWRRHQVARERNLFGSTISEQKENDAAYASSLKRQLKTSAHIQVIIFFN